jgi:hypothetical protein
MIQKKPYYGLIALAFGLGAPAMSYALNPQPEPPASVAKKKVESPLARKAINPQPEPPGEASKKPVSPGVKQGFNPQPEPPGAQLKPGGNASIGPKPEDPVQNQPAAKK